MIVKVYKMNMLIKNEIKPVKMVLLDDYNELQRRTDKAIKFLEEWGKEPDADMYMLINEYKEFAELLNILKGSDNNEER